VQVTFVETQHGSPTVVQLDALGRVQHVQTAETVAAHRHRRGADPLHFCGSDGIKTPEPARLADQPAG
jgi:hypothetical protein